MGSKLLYTLPALGLAFLALVLALIGLSRELESSAPDAAASPPPAVEREPTHDYWMVSEPLQAGATLTEEHLTVVSSPTPIAQALSADEAVIGQPLRRFARAGELLGPHHLEAGGNLPASLPEGQRAIAIAVDNVTSAGGLLRPGDQVDVVTAFRRSDKDNPVALVMLRKVPVLAVRGALSASQQGDDNRRNDTVVLSVPEDKVPALMLASSQGQVRLAVVASDDRPTPDPGHHATADRTATATGMTAGIADSDAPGATPFYFDDFFPEPPKPAPVRRASPGRQVQVFEGAEARSTYVR